MEKIKTSYKVIIAIIIATIFLALSLGLYAILNHKGGMGASINFTATGVSGTITGEVNAYDSTKFNSQLTPAYDTSLIEQSTYSAAFSPRTYSMADWNVGLIRFLPNDINYTGIVGLDLTITNTGTKPILLTFPSPTLTATNVAIQYVCNNKTIQFAGLGIDNFSIASGEELDISLQLYIPDRKAFSSSTNIQINIKLVEDTTTVSAPTITFPAMVDQTASAIPERVVAGQDYSMLFAMPIGNVLTNYTATCNGTTLTTSFDYNTNILTIENSANEITGPVEIATSTVGLAGGSGTAEDPLRISSAQELTTFATFVNSGNAKYSKLSYKLTQPVDLSGAEHQPIGTSSNPFQGTFNGNDQPISNLTINQPTKNYLGLFGYTKNSTIESVVVESGDIIGQTNVGGIVGYAENTIIKDAVNKANVEGSGICAGVVARVNSSSVVEFCDNYGSVLAIRAIQEIVANGGGICGLNYYGAVRGCRNFSNIQLRVDYNQSTIYDNAVGGVVGRNYGLVEQCYNEGDMCELTSIYEVMVGGVVGYTRGDVGVVKNCYNTGNVNGGRYSGGAVGAVSTYAGSVGHVFNCYSTTYPEGRTSDQSGGVAGSNACAGSKVEYCYYLSETAKNAIAPYGIRDGSSDLGTSHLTDSQMQLKESFVGWDFENVWTFDRSSDYKYPVLRCFL